MFYFLFLLIFLVRKLLINVKQLFYKLFLELNYDKFKKIRSLVKILYIEKDCGILCFVYFNND